MTAGIRRASLRSIDRPGAGQSDTELLGRIRAGDEHALDRLMERYWSELHAYLNHIVQSPDLAEDLVQETFVRVWERREAWRIEGSLRGLLCQIGRRLAFDDRRRRRRRAAWVNGFHPQPAVPTPADVLDRTELDQAVERAISALPERRRLAFLMARWEGLSHREIAEALGISPQTVANQLTTALADLRAVLRPFITQTGRSRNR
ncbi:MAG: sigma-70 family RNA polymerase sigma factor [Gemmatimonadota bacterium]